MMYKLPKPSSDLVCSPNHVRAAYAAGLAEGRKVSEGRKLVPVAQLQNIADSLGSFCSDHGWSDFDMDTLDNVLALIAVAPEPVTYHLRQYGDVSEAEMQEYVATGSIGKEPKP